MMGHLISILHVILLAMTFIGLKNHVTIIPPLLIHVGRDGWISVLMAALFLLPWLFVPSYLHKKTNQENLMELLKQTLGKKIANTFLVVFGLILIILAAFTMREVLQWINATFLTETPVFILLIIYTVLCILLACTNLQTIVIANAFTLFGVVVFGFFVAITNLQVKDYNLLRPFFEHGYEPVLKGMIYPASGFVEVILFLFIQHKINGEMRTIHYLVIVGILTSLTLGPYIGAITEFGPVEAANQRYPAYEEWGLVSIGRYIEHLDFLSIYQWLTGVFIRVGFILYIVTLLFNIERKTKAIWIRIVPFFFIVCFILISLDDQTFINIKGNYVLPITFFIFFIISLFLTILAIFSRRSAQ